MNIRRELLALAIRILSNETSLVRKPDQFEIFLNHVMGVESYDQRMARNIDESLDQVTDAVKRAKTNREFKKITKNV